MQNKNKQLDELAGIIIAFVLIIMLSALWSHIKGPAVLSYIEYLEDKKNESRSGN